MNHLHRGFSKSLLFAVALSTVLFGVGCENMGKKSALKARKHVEFLTTSAKRDLSEVQKGLPAGAKYLASVFEEAAPEQPAAVDVREELLRVRSKNNDLDSAKCTFFLVAAPDGTILRNNLEQDDMAGKNLFSVYPQAKEKRTKKCFDFTGSWDVARGVNGREDAQWVSACPILGGEDGRELGLFVGGWSWSSYAYRLEMSLRSEILGDTPEGHKMPLLYVYVLVGNKSYGTPIAPEINGQELLKLKPLEKVKGAEIWSSPVTIENREFGVAMQRIPGLGKDMILAVLRSET